MKYLVYGLFFSLMSCAALGSRTKIYSDTRVKEIKTIGLITKRANQPRPPHQYHRIIKEAFTKTLIEELEKKTLFKIIVLDTMENENLNIQAYESDAPIDAFLLAEWKLSNPLSSISDSKVTISLLDVKTKEVLLVSSHGSKFGNSYWLAPLMPATLIDAVEGAIKTLEKNIKSK